MPPPLASPIAFVLLRCAVLTASVAVAALLAVLIGSLLSQGQGAGWDDPFDRLGHELMLGGAAGLVVGVVLAVRLGRRRFDRISRVLQTLAALAIPPLLLSGAWMERSHEANGNLTVFDV